MDQFFFAFPLCKGQVAETEDFRRAKKAFSHKRNIEEWISEDHVILVSPIENHLVYTSDASHLSFSVGLGAWTHNSSSSQPFLKINVSKSQNEVRIETDSFGLFSYFYAKTTDVLLVSNHFLTMVGFLEKSLTLSEQAITDVIVTGACFPGETIFENIKMGSPWADLVCKATDGRLEEIAKKNPIPRSPVKVEEIYDMLCTSVHTLLQHHQIQWFTLTGGADTRLILSLLDDEVKRKYEFIFDEISASPEHIPFDKEIVVLLATTFHLKIHKNFPPISSPSFPLHLEPHKESVHRHVLTGLYGGEILGGAALNEPLHIQIDEKLCDSFIRQRAIQQRLKNHFAIEGELAFFILCYTNSFMSFIYDDKNWQFPYSIGQRKISPFVNSDILRSVLSWPEEQVKNYELYRTLYKRCAPQYMQLPFHSQLDTVSYRQFMLKKAPRASTLSFKETVELNLQESVLSKIYELLVKGLTHSDDKVKLSHRLRVMDGVLTKLRGA